MYLVAKASGANEDPYMRSLRTFRQRATTTATKVEESSSSASIVEVHQELSG